MSKRTLYTVITPLPSTVSRETAVEGLHNHAEMIQLNPLVINYKQCRPHASSPPDEYHATWYQLTDRISYLPGITSKVTYKACFHDLPRGLQTHVYAPAGLHIKEKWTIGGNAPGEPREVLELGLAGVPRDGLYVREDVDMQCNILLSSFVKKNLKRAHSVLVDRLVISADLEDDRRIRSQYLPSSPPRGVNAVQSWRGSLGEDTGEDDLHSRYSTKIQCETLETPRRDLVLPTTDERNSWSTRSPTVPSLSGSTSTRSNSMSRSEVRSSQPPAVPPQSPRRISHHPRFQQVYHAAAAAGYNRPSPYYEPATVAFVAELPADDLSVPAYKQQQQYEEEQIRNYFSQNQVEHPATRAGTVRTNSLHTPASRFARIDLRPQSYELP